jgi:long-chain fatty acid transport protein
MHRTLARRVLPAALATLFGGSAFASGFQLLEQNASGLGNAYAGTAAVAADASTIFYNPAGMSLLGAGTQVSFGIDAIKPSAKFSNSGSQPALAVPPATPHALGTATGDAGGWSGLPAGYLATDLMPGLRAGLGINAPFGLKTDYDAGWIGRFQAITSEVKTINVNPSLSYQATSQIAVAIGLDYQKIDAKFSSAVNYPLALYSAMYAATGSAATAVGAAAAQNAANPEGPLHISGNDTAWGYNLGMIINVDPTTRVGVAYRSPIKYHVTGTANTASGNPALDAALNKAVFADIKLPDTFTVSGYKRLDDKWEVMADLAWTGWAKIQDLNFRFADTGAMLSATHEGWRNTWRGAIGASYQFDTAWKLRAGLAYDQTMVPDQFRTPRLPDNDRTWISVGAQYRINAKSALDVGYAHLFVKNGTISDNGGSPQQQAVVGLLQGNYKNQVDILGFQYSATF